MTRPLRTTDRVLVCLPAWLGDVVQAEPAVRALCASHGESRVSLAGDEHLLDVLDGCLPAARRIAHAGRRGARAEAWRGHDVALLLPGSFRSAWLAARAGIARRVGWARDGRSLLLTDRVVPPLERGRVPLGLGRVAGGRRYLPRPYTAACIELVGRLGVSVGDTRPRLVAAGDELERVRASLRAADHAADAPWALACVGAREGSAKAFGVEGWARALRAFSERTGWPVVAVGGPGEAPAVERVRELCASSLAIAEAVVGLGTLRALASLASLVLTTDSGSRHVAAAMGAPVACVAGPTDPRHSADHLERQALVRVEVPCGPCHLERCPIRGPGRHACMGSIDPLVFAACALELARVG